ncbi:DUF1203 domain-containing protein [Sulfitobacter sp. MF3-043]|uniref:DUF1203 domain-containing protein n=1 Tax=Sulfitobacter sediminivivens TaxID=3252902 RepID=UPI0036DE5A9F
MHYSAMPTNIARGYQTGMVDAYDNAPELAVSNGPGTPCRHCLKNIPKGAGMLILAYRPFDGLHPYAETGPIFLCAEPCGRGGGDVLPPVLTTSPAYLVKGYSSDDRIVYGTGAIVKSAEIPDHTAQVLKDPRVRYVHVRSASNNCYLARIDRD